MFVMAPTAHLPGVQQCTGAVGAGRDRDRRAAGSEIHPHRRLAGVVADGVGVALGELPVSVPTPAPQAAVGDDDTAEGVAHAQLAGVEAVHARDAAGGVRVRVGDRGEGRRNEQQPNHRLSQVHRHARFSPRQTNRA